MAKGEDYWKQRVKDLLNIYDAVHMFLHRNGNGLKKKEVCRYVMNVVLRDWILKRLELNKRSKQEIVSFFRNM